MQQIKKIMLHRFGKDLNQFKRPFLNRRINARMRAVGVQDGSEYAKLLESDSNEPSLLFRSFSINVTEFYRDLFVWQHLSSQTVPQILQTSGGLPLKIWSAGCASGEEPYSLAILLKEAVGQNLKFNVVATDINKEALQTAKKGQYTSANLKNLSPQLIEKYFVKINNDAYEIKDEIKKLVSFEQGDILSFQIDRANLITCRNVLIYYDKPAQEIVFKKFHKVLMKNGFLVIGQDETMMGVEASKMFSCILPRERIYTKVIQHG
jgi:chemotaxis protein methyltransferase CheR